MCSQVISSYLLILKLLLQIESIVPLPIASQVADDILPENIFCINAWIKITESHIIFGLFLKRLIAFLKTKKRKIRNGNKPRTPVDIAISTNILCG
jgi:hypothetical protein